MAQITRSDLKPGFKFRYFVEEEDKAYLTEVTEVHGDIAHLKDIDRDSMDFGLEWPDAITSIKEHPKHEFIEQEEE